MRKPTNSFRRSAMHRKPRLAEHVLDVIRRRSDAIRATASLTSNTRPPGLIVELSDSRTPRSGQLDYLG